MVQKVDKQGIEEGAVGHSSFQQEEDVGEYKYK
jgi:hypothetical protein